MTTHQIHMAFVIGGSGFVGRHLFADLQARGIAVRALARSQVAREALQQAGVEPSEGDLADPVVPDGYLGSHFALCYDGAAVPAALDRLDDQCGHARGRGAGCLANEKRSRRSSS